MIRGCADSRFGIAPLPVVAGAVVFGVAVVVVVAVLAMQRPWLGLELKPAAEGVGVVVAQAAATGPAADLTPGTRVVEVEGGEDRMELTAFDLTTEPDGAMGDYVTYRRFLERQSRLARIQDAVEVVFVADDGRRFVVTPRAGGRPLVSLPADFWVQCLVGLVAWLVSAGVFAFRPGDAAARYLFLSGAATLMFAPAAAVYTTRELAVDGTLLRWASDLNFLGGSLFAASFVALLLVYPRRVAPGWVGPAVVALFVVWFVAQQVGVFESMTFARRFLVMVGVLVTFGLAAVHWRGTGRDPLGRAALQWFLLSWVLGTGLFALFILLPQTLGVDTSPVQGYAFLLFLLVYGGLAFGILRYRLFDLGTWWRRVMVWTVTVVVLILLDAVFVFGLHLSSAVSLSLALLICGVVWLPLRAWIWHRFSVRRGPVGGDVFGRVMDIALASPGARQDVLWVGLLKSVFEPLEVAAVGGGLDAVAVAGDGLALEVPGVGALPGVRLEYARAGRALFTPQDVELAREMVAMLRHGMESVTLYDRGVTEERGRIARDVHDNIGAQLLAALHHGDAGAKDERIRAALADLRDVVNNLTCGCLSLEETLAELRVETADRMQAAGIALRWVCGGGAAPVLDPLAMHSLRSIVREAVSNVIRHSGASRAEVTVRCEGNGLALVVEDDGCGFAPDTVAAGNGLRNIRARVERLGGTLELAGGGTGMRLAMRLPVSDRIGPK